MEISIKKIKFIILIGLLIFLLAVLYMIFAGENLQTELSQEEPLGDVQNEKADLGLKQRELDTILSYSALDQETGEADLSVCAQISDSYIKDICYDRLATASSTLEADWCYNISDGDSQKICLLKVYKALAKKAKDPAVCNGLVEEKFVENCIRWVVKVNLCEDDDVECLEEFLNNKEKYDKDGDGLTDLEEIWIYKTDPNNKDTDGDGYSDGEEVAGGYNPLGPGSL